MSKIIWIRHGQASFLSDDYDKLSETGIRQASMLGKFWQHSGLHADKIYTGTLLRQRETAIHTLNELTFDPVSFTLDAFDEHHGPHVMEHYYGDRFKPHPDKEEMRNITKNYFRTYQSLTRKWISNALDQDVQAEPWEKFRERVNQGFQEVLNQTSKGETVLIFTSGGTVAAAVGQVLGLEDAQILELSWMVKNASFTEFLYSGGKLTLNTFNETPHLALSGLQSMI